MPSKVETILAGTAPLTPAEQKTLVKAAAILQGKCERLRKYADLEENKEKRELDRLRLGDYVAQALRLTNALLTRGTPVVGRGLGSR